MLLKLDLKGETVRIGQVAVGPTPFLASDGLALTHPDQHGPGPVLPHDASDSGTSPQKPTSPA